MDIAAQLKRLSKEVDQLSVAVSVVGTRREKLTSIAKKTSALFDQLHGSRPEIAQLLLRLRQRMHDLAVSRADPSASMVLIALKELLDDAARTVRSGVGVGPEAFDVGSIEVGNPWGYSEDEARRAIEVIRAVVGRLVKLTVPVDTLTVVLDPEWSTDTIFATYDRDWETIAMSASAPASEAKLAHEMGLALWDQVLDPSDREVWGDKQRFARAFASYFTGQSVSDDESTRLHVTIGRSASKWPQRGA